MTYREAIQSVQAQFDELNGKLNALRDYADLAEKPFFNRARLAAFGVLGNLISLDDHLPEDRATMHVKGNY